MQPYYCFTCICTCGFTCISLKLLCVWINGHPLISGITREELELSPEWSIVTRFFRDLTNASPSKSISKKQIFATGSWTAPLYLWGNLVRMWSLHAHNATSDWQFLHCNGLSYQNQSCCTQAQWPGGYCICPFSYLGLFNIGARTALIQCEGEIVVC